MRHIYLLAILLLALPAAYAQAQSPAALSYQGYVEDGGSPVDDGNATLAFRLFDVASGGSPLWSETHSGVDVSGGVFDVTLGSVAPLSSLEFHRPLWVEVEIGEGASASTLAPRTPLAASPYTMGLVLPILQDASIGGTALSINNTGSGDGIKGETHAAAGRGVVGWASAFTGAAYGVYGLSQSAEGTGVYGVANTTLATDPNYGVYGETNSTSGYGVYGEHVGGHTGHLGGSSAGVRGDHPDGNFGTLGRHDSGAWGKHAGSGNYGYLGTVANGVSGANGNGNIGRLAHAAYGVFGYATNGNAGFFTTAGTSNSNTVLNLNGNLNTSSLLAGGLPGNKQFEFDLDGSLRLYRSGSAVIELDTDLSGDARVITQELEITGGSDLSEHFDVAPSPSVEAPEPGMVVAIDPRAPGRLVVTDQAYDPMVAGIVSGAGGIKTGMIMGQRGSVADGAFPVALVGRVYVLVDAGYGGVEPGDLLTTSDTPGHAMKAADPSRAYGTVIGKAMTGLEQGRGLVLVLVSLQ